MLVHHNRKSKTVGLLVGTFVIKPRLPHGGDDDPVTLEIDGVAVSLIDGGHAASGEGPLQWIARAFTLNGDGEALGGGGEAPEGGICELAVHLDVSFS